jgi:hypothetical protein
MPSTLAFKPNTTITISSTASNAAVLLPGVISDVSLGSTGTLRIVSPSNNPIIWVAFGADNSVVATAAGYPIMPGTVEYITVDTSWRYIATKVDSGGTTGTLYVTSGYGV